MWVFKEHFCLQKKSGENKMLHAEMVYMNTSCMCFRRSDDSKFGKGGIKSIWYTFWPQMSAYVMINLQLPQKVVFWI